MVSCGLPNYFEPSESPRSDDSQSEETVIRAQLAVASTSFTRDQIADALQLQPDSGYTIGDASRIASSHTYSRSSWVRKITLDPNAHAGTAALSSAVDALGSDLAARLAELHAQGCDVVLSVVQEVSSRETTADLGLHLSVDAVAWLARSGASVDIDQYLLE